MTTEVWREFSFEAAHWLPRVPAGHKCARTHGHSYRVRVHVRGELGIDSGWVVDFGDIAARFEPLRARLDHSLLNETLDNPTIEALAAWLFYELRPVLPGLCRVVVMETAATGASYGE